MPPGSAPGSASVARIETTGLVDVVLPAVKGYTLWIATKHGCLEGSWMSTQMRLGPAGSGIVALLAGSGPSSLRGLEVTMKSGRGFHESCNEVFVKAYREGLVKTKKYSKEEAADQKVPPPFWEYTKAP
jgi:hypothetical protein